MNEEQRITQTTEPSAANQALPASPSPVVGGAYTTAPSVGLVPQKGSRRKLFGKLGILPVAAIAGFLLIAGSAAAYLGVIVPNQPENVLKAAFQNTAKETQVSVDGIAKFESTDKNAEIKAFNIGIKGQSDSVKKAFQTELTLTASGVTLPVEVRKIDNILYIKLGDLRTIKGLAAAAAPEYAELIDAANDTVANQWIEIDETLLKQAGADCALNTSMVLNQQDIDVLASKYQQAAFVTVKSTQSETVNNRAAYRYELEIDNKKAEEFGRGLDELSFVKELKECTDENESASETSEAEGVTPLTIWVDKGTKTLRKIVMQTTEEAEKESQLKGSVEVTFDYGSASIAKPEDAKPAMEVVAELQALLMDGVMSDPSRVQGIFDIQEVLGESTQ